MLSVLIIYQLIIINTMPITWFKCRYEGGGGRWLRLKGRLESEHFACRVRKVYK